MRFRGQGATFGNPLISKMAAILSGMNGEGCTEDDIAVKASEHPIKFMPAFIYGKIIKYRGEVGRQWVKNYNRYKGS